MRLEFDVAIVGAGPVGSVLAALLVRRNVCAPGRVALIDPRLARDGDGADWDLRVFAINRASQRLLAASGVWGRLPRSRIQGYERLCVWDAAGSAGGPGSLTFDCAEIGEPDLGSIVDGRSLKWHGLQAARQLGVVVVEADVRAVSIDEGAARIRLGDGREVSAGLVAVADGSQSPTRQRLGIGTAGHSYASDALVAHVVTAIPHRNTAWQRFLPTGPLAFLPLSDGRSSIVWSAVRDEADRLCALDPASFGEALESASAGVLGKTRLDSAVGRHPLRLRTAERFVRERVALLGDAAHAVHPLAGQGLNLGLLDCGALVAVLEAADDPRAFGDRRVLRRYERWRRSEVLPAAAGFDAFDRLFSNADPVFAALRSTGLGLVARAPLAKRWFAAQALGTAGDLPPFIAGHDEITDDRSSPRR